MNYKYCTHCGRKISTNNQFCPYCGTRQLNTSSLTNYNLHPHYYNYHKKNKALWIIGAVCLVAVVFFGGMYVKNKNESTYNLNTFMKEAPLHKWKESTHSPDNKKIGTDTGSGISTFSNNHKYHEKFNLHKEAVNGSYYDKNNYLVVNQDVLDSQHKLHIIIYSKFTKYKNNTYYFKVIKYLTKPSNYEMQKSARKDFLESTETFKRE